MDNQAAAKKTEMSKHNLRVKILLDNLRQKLKNFRVLDNQGTEIGTVNDVYLSNTRQINLLISPGNLPKAHTFSLRSNQIQQVDYPNKSILANIEQSEIPSMLASPQSAKISQEDTQSNLSDGYVNNPESSDSITTEVLEQEVIRLLEERLVVNHEKRKVGEVIVRKEIETRMVEVPVKYEKLIVEQVSPESKVIAEVDLSQQPDDATGTREIAFQQTNSNNTVKGEFTSPKTASLLLDAIDKQKHHDCKLVRVEIVLDNPENLRTYQEWFDRCSGT
ncbi:YsnF/AvaK domain-containing protein [Aerosakkonemataceae cyanobacterium BLCC-F154]|uniref:YsnF/AvaK domain-containing protein n=1 Tax=Floridaenema fluviatile BLCC-F154 TaxID=3153640 RepID=A0ABV4Y652_9CYAN